MSESGKQYSARDNKNKPVIRPAVFYPIIAACLVIIGIQIGVLVNKVGLEKDPILVKSNPNSIEEILNYIDRKYVDTVDTDRIYEDAIHQLLAELDPHSTYIPLREVKAMEESMSGQFQGIGIEFFIVSDTIQVVTPISGGPSEELGIMAGDKIIYIDDTLVAGVGIQNSDVMDKLRGKKGSKVKVGILRNGDELIDFDITRDNIPLYSLDVGYMMDDEVGYIKINRFSATTYEEFRQKLTELKEQGMTKLILDLRQNPGGYLDAAIAMLDEFIGGKKLVLYTEGQAYARNDYETKFTGEFETGDLMILIDEGSASASEIVAGAIQDWDRGVVVGRRSFGKGLVQEQYELKDGSLLRLTVARYYIPSGRSIQRPYDGGLEAYYEELYERYEHGEFLSADSMDMGDSLIYYTNAKRVVFGGGGIMPDIFVSIDTTVNWSYMNKLRQYIPEFIYNYYSSHTAEFKQYQYDAGDGGKQQFPILSADGQKTLKSFVKNYKVSNEVYNSFIEFAIDKGLKRDNTELAKLESRTKTNIKAFLAKQIWNTDGYYPVINDLDETLQEAYDAIKKGNMQAILSPE